MHNGETVEFVTPDGQLLRQRWIHESGGVDPNEKKEGVDISTLRVPALLELLPNVPLERYEFRAELKISTPVVTQPGIYVLHHVARQRQGPANSFLSLSFGEQGPGGHLFGLLQYQDQINSNSKLATPGFQPERGQWHTLTVQVTPEEVRSASW